MSRRSAEETRRLLLDTGIEMLHERGVTAGVGHIRLQEVLKRTGLTTGAAYRLWSDQDDYHRSLAVAATRWRDEAPVNATIAAIRDLVDERECLDEVIRVASAAQLESLAGIGDERQLSTFLTTLALRAAAVHDLDLRAASSARHRDSIDSFLELYGILLKVYARTVRPPFTLRQFAVALAALSEGFALQAIEGEAHPTVYLPTSTGSDELIEWTLLGIAVKALAEVFTVADPIAEPSVTASRVSSPDK